MREEIDGQIAMDTRDYLTQETVHQANTAMNELYVALRKTKKPKIRSSQEAYGVCMENLTKVTAAFKVTKSATGGLLDSILDPALPTEDAIAQVIDKVNLLSGTALMMCADMKRALMDLMNVDEDEE